MPEAPPSPVAAFASGYSECARRPSARRRRARAGCVAVMLGVAMAAAANGATAPEPSAARGGTLVNRHCGGCHAAGSAGASRNPAAPPLRQLYRRYEPDVLAEALAEGILTGHPAMPAFRFEPRDVRSIILYLEGIQDRQTS